MVTTVLVKNNFVEIINRLFIVILSAMSDGSGITLYIHINISGCFCVCACVCVCVCMCDDNWDRVSVARFDAAVDVASVLLHSHLTFRVVLHSIERNNKIVLIIFVLYTMMTLVVIQLFNKSPIVSHHENRAGLIE